MTFRILTSLSSWNGNELGPRGAASRSVSGGDVSAAKQRLHPRICSQSTGAIPWHPPLNLAHPRSRPPVRVMTRPGCMSRDRSSINMSNGPVREAIQLPFDHRQSEFRPDMGRADAVRTSSFPFHDDNDVTKRKVTQPATAQLRRLPTGTAVARRAIRQMPREYNHPRDYDVC